MSGEPPPVCVLPWGLRTGVGEAPSLLFLDSLRRQIKDCSSGMYFGGGDPPLAIPLPSSSLFTGG